jgi:hypothetical protein
MNQSPSALRTICWKAQRQSPLSLVIWVGNGTAAAYDILEKPVPYPLEKKAGIGVYAFKSELIADLKDPQTRVDRKDKRTRGRWSMALLRLLRARHRAARRLLKILHSVRRCDFIGGGAASHCR